ncbi:hypothetical protein [Thalassobaculum sp.]|uniref:hypothetical protein n=1 Tax=Thalassobaculum sp. TaxID=2022740 RepID=UPI0032EAB70A
MTGRAMKQASFESPGRRAVLTGGGALILSGCAGGATDSGASQAQGTAIIGLRLGDRPSEDANRNSSSSPWSLFDRPPPAPRAEVSFGYIEPKTGGIDLPILPGYSGKMAEPKTEGSATTFVSASLFAGDYATIRGLIFPGSKTVYVLRFSAGSNNRLIAPDDIGGYGFTVNPGDVVYVGTMVLVSYGTGRVRIDDEFDAAASAFPELAQVGRERGSRLMASIGIPRSRRG